jgi:flagellar hook-basal body complex protein FliE
MDAISGQFRAFANPAFLAGQFSRNLGEAQEKFGADQVAKIGESVPLAAPRIGNGADSFSSVLGKMVADVNAKQAEATQATEATLAGQNVPLHHTMIAMEEASVAFQLMVEVRNKLLESYQELMRMQV